MCLQGSMDVRLTWVRTHNPVVGAEGTTESSATTSSTMVSMTPGQDVKVFETTIDISRSRGGGFNMFQLLLNESLTPCLGRRSTLTICKYV